MKIVNKVLISVDESDLVDGVFYNKSIIEIASGCFSNMRKLISVNLPKVKKIGGSCFRNNSACTAYDLPALTTTGGYCFSNNSACTAYDLPALTTTGGSCFSDNSACTAYDLPALTTTGDYCFRNNSACAAYDLPALTTTGGSCFSNNSACAALKLGKHKMPVKNVDGYCFVIEAEKTSKGIKIYTGYNFCGMEKKIIRKQFCFVSEKEGFTAHGDTVKKSILDLQFKIVSEKLKKEPIKKDTLFTVKYYRLLTGACDMGCRDWLTRNNVPFEVINDEAVEKKPIKAADLLPMLQKSNAWGLETFKSLATF